MPASAAAQSPQVIRSDGGGFDRAAAIATDRDGNTFIGGSSESSAGQNTFTVVKLGPDGSRRFTARCDGSRGGVLGSVTAVGLDAAGNVYAAGTSPTARAAPAARSPKSRSSGAMRPARVSRSSIQGTFVGLGRAGDFEREPSSGLAAAAIGAPSDGASAGVRAEVTLACASNAWLVRSALGCGGGCRR